MTGERVGRAKCASVLLPAALGARPLFRASPTLVHSLDLLAPHNLAPSSHSTQAYAHMHTQIHTYSPRKSQGRPRHHGANKSVTDERTVRKHAKACTSIPKHESSTNGERAATPRRDRSQGGRVFYPFEAWQGTPPPWC